MAKANAPLYALNQGEVSTIALTRVDIAKMRLAATCQLNWMPWVIGPMMLRPGLEHIGEIKADSPTKLLPFIFARDDTAVIELTPLVMRVWVDDALVTRPAVATVIGDGTFLGTGAWDTATGTTAVASASMSLGSCQLTCTPIGGVAQIRQTVSVAAPDLGVEHGLRIVVVRGPVTVRVGSTMGGSDYVAQSVLDIGTHSLAFTPTTNFSIQIESYDARSKFLSSVTIDTAGTLELPTPWGAGDLANIRYDESGDIIFIACEGLQQHKIERRSAHGWSVVRYRSDNGPFSITPANTPLMNPDVYSGNGNLFVAQPYFQPGHLGALFRLFVNGQASGSLLGAENATTPVIRVTGVGAQRDFVYTLSGTWTGTAVLQRSFDGPGSGFVSVDSGQTVNGDYSEDTGGSLATPDLDNVIAWYRVQFATYGSGAVMVKFSFTGGGGFGIARVTGFISNVQVSIEVLQPFPSQQSTTDWVESAWSDAQNWPTSVCFHEGRLGWFGQNNTWLSESNNYTGFANQDPNGDPLGDAGAIIEQLGSGDVDTISWGVSSLRLLMGRERSIACARSSSFDEPMTPTAFSVKDCSTQGAGRMAALKVDQSVYFLQQSGRRIYKASFNAQAMDYAAHDLTRLNLDIGKAGFVDNAVARQPDTTELWVRGDGQVAIMLDDADDDVVAWWRLQTLGVIENCIVLPGPGIEDLQYFVVRRIINGVTRRFLERLALRDDCVGGSLNKQADSFVTYTGAPSATITAAHLPNTTGILWADGKSLGTVTTNGSGVATLPNGATASNIVFGLGGVVVSYPPSASDPQPATNTLTVGTQYNGYPAEVYADQNASGRLKHVGPLTVSGGVITLPNNRQASNIVAFLGYVAPFESAKLAYGAQGGTALTMKKKIDHVGLVLYNTHAQGVSYGQDFAHLDPLPQIEDGNTVDQDLVWAEYDEPTLALDGKWDTDARLCLLAQAPLPCMVGGVVVAMQTNEKM